MNNHNTNQGLLKSLEENSTKLQELSKTIESK